MKHTNIRLPDDLMTYLQDEAVMAGESLSAHIRNRLALQQIKRMVLVDYENIYHLDFEVEPTDKVVLFIGASQFKIKVEDAIKMQALGDRGEYILIDKVGPNALDFCLTYTLGKLRVLYPYRSFAIVSNDSGFDSVVSFMKEEGADICRIGTIKKEVPLVEKIEKLFKGNSQGNPRTLDALKTFLINRFPNYTEADILNSINYFLGKRKLIINGSRLSYYM